MTGIISVGETSGKAAKGMAKIIAGSGGMHHLTAQSTSVGGEVARTKQVRKSCCYYYYYCVYICKISD